MIVGECNIFGIFSIKYIYILCLVLGHYAYLKTDGIGIITMECHFRTVQSGEVSPFSPASVLRNVFIAEETYIHVHSQRAYLSMTSGLKYVGEGEVRPSQLDRIGHDTVHPQLTDTIQLQHCTTDTRVKTLRFSHLLCNGI